MNVPSPKLGTLFGTATQSHIHDLEALIRSRTPLVAIETGEEPEIVELIRQIARRIQIKAFRWTVTEGLQAFEPADQPTESVVKVTEILSYIKTSGAHSLFLLLDFHPFLQETTTVRYLKDIAISYPKHFSTVLLSSHALALPEELRPFTSFFKLPLPGQEQLRQIVSDVAAQWCNDNNRYAVESTNKAMDLLVRNLAGLTSTDARRLALKAINDDGVISSSDIPAVMRAKYELLGRDAVLSFEYDTARFAEIGGLRRLRKWLEQRRAFFLEPHAEELDPPRGLLLIGVQGCGKSLAAKAAAGIFGVPLLRLDFGTLYNKYYGETERNLRRALETAEVLSPCVLWMDELEKGVAVSDDDDGLSRRVLGILLTWMSERQNPVFLVATANDITRLPPEMVRKGRFDEIFFVDLPNLEIRKEILSIHLTKRALEPLNFDLGGLAKATESFSGSELEQAIVSARYSAKSQGRELKSSDVLEEIHQTKPLSAVMAEQVQALRDWAENRTVPAD
jgi:ATP-dependent 26S proteasome regulatory subunit